MIKQANNFLKRTLHFERKQETDVHRQRSQKYCTPTKVTSNIDDKMLTSQKIFEDKQLRLKREISERMIKNNLKTNAY